MSREQALHDYISAKDTPDDAYGAGFIEYSIRQDFRNLCRLIGKEAARQEVAEIVNAEFERRTIEHG